MHDDTPKRFNKRPPLRETIMDMDRDLLKMLARRCNILDKMKARHGYLDPQEEKELRTAWEKQATSMSRDPRIIKQLFSLLQELQFSPKPEAGAAKDRQGFNLAPSQKPMDVKMQAPLACRRSRLFLALAAVSGSTCRMHPTLLNDATIQCIKMFNQCATSLAWEEDGTVLSRQGGGLSLPDKVIFVGDDLLNFYLLLGHYVGKVTRAKFSGESSLKLKDMATLRQFLPQLGARLSHAIPKSTGFPVRVECSGILPDTITIPANLDADAVTGFFMAAPFWEKPVTFDLSAYDKQQAAQIIEEAFSVLLESGAKVRQEGALVHFKPSAIVTPAAPQVGMDLSLVPYILAWPFAASQPTSLGGRVELEGVWPKCPISKRLGATLAQCGLYIELNASSVVAKAGGAPTEKSIDMSAIWDDGEVDMRFLPLVVACTLIPAFHGQKQCRIPQSILEAAPESVIQFLQHFNFEIIEDGILKHRVPIPKKVPVYDEPREYARFDRGEESGHNERDHDGRDHDERDHDERSYDSRSYDNRSYDERSSGDNSHGERAADSGSARGSYGAPYGASYAPEPRYVIQDDGPAIWTAPNPAWAMAFALCAFARQHIKLANPGIMTSLYPHFWQVYNALPCPADVKPKVTEPEHDKPVRRRIIAADQDGTGSGDSNN